MDILVTGGTVFAGRYAAEYFSRHGHNVYVLNRGNQEQSADVIHIRADRHDLGDVLKKYSFDAVLDITAYNAGDVNDLLDGLGEFGKYILISSSAVYPETLEQPFREDQQCGPNSIWGAYGTDKIGAECALCSRFPGGYILRPPYLYGLMNNLYREAFVFECAEKGRPFYMPRDGRLPLQFFHIDDLCRFMELILNSSPEQHIFNTGNAATISAEEWVRLCYDAAGCVPEIRYVDGAHEQRSYFPFYDYAYELDVSRMNGIMPDTIPLADGLRGAYSWYVSNRDKVRRKPLIGYIDRYL